MSLFSSFIIDPVVRQARRFSGATLTQPLSHVNNLTSPQDGPIYDDAHGNNEAAESESENGNAVPEGQNRALHTAISPRPTAPIDIQNAADRDGQMSSNPRTLASQLRQLALDSPNSLSTTPASTSTRTSAQGAQSNAPAMSDSLPADDGMRHLRARIHQIRDLRVADAEKAQMMHGLMTERYNHLRPTSPSSFVSHDRPFTPASGTSAFSDGLEGSPLSAAEEVVDPENPYNLRLGDTDPTYRSKPVNHIGGEGGENEEGDGDGDFDQYEEEVTLGCQHYKRNVKVQCFECRRWHTCRHCHDAVEDHYLNRVMTQNMLCMACGTPQKAGECCVHCGTQAACYYCDTCKLWDNNSTKKIYHCADCGICRRGEGLGKDYIHCKNCNVCISIAHATSHKCIERATDCDCPICGEWLFNSSTAVVSMPCGHYLHKGCYNQYMETAYKCPTCKKSAVNMELQWQKLTQAIESQPMPEQFADTRAIIQCNDCSARSSVKYHWLGNKCGTCDSYNTNELRILNGPQSEQNANAILSADTEDLSPGAQSPLSVSSPASQPLRSPRYYFQPDEPEQTWLPAELPSFPFQMPQIPQFPGMPQIPQLPGMPQFPQFPGMPQMPQMFPGMPQMPDPYEMLERVRSSFDHYLNPTGEVPNEAVPIIDLDMDNEDPRPDVKATDGTTVRLPSLPQYVLERFNQSITPLRNYLTPISEQIPQLNLDDVGEFGSLSWGPDWRRTGRDDEGDEDTEEEDESSGSSEESGEDDEEEERDAEDDKHDFQLPGHR